MNLQTNCAIEKQNYNFLKILDTYWKAFLTFIDRGSIDWIADPLQKYNELR